MAVINNVDRPIAEELLQRCHMSVVATALEVGRLALDGTVEEADGVELVATGSTFPQLNSAIVARVPDDPARVFAAARRFFATRRGGWRLWAWGEAADAIGLAAPGAGFVEQAREPGVVLTDLPESIPPGPRGVDVERVRDGAGVMAFQRAFSAVFDIHSETVARVFNTGLLDLPNAAVLVGRADGALAGMAIGFEHDRVLNIMTAGTLPRFRRRGIATYLVRHAMLAAHETCDAVYALPAAGYRVYEDLGFREVAEYRFWTL